MPELKHIPLHEIDEPPLPMRASMDEGRLTELMNSLVNIGQQLPAQVKLVDGRYRIFSGHRRFIALQRLGRDRMMCLVYGPDEKLDLDAMVSENVDREDVNAAQEALFYAQVMDERKLGEAELCALVKRSPDYIADRFRLLRNDEMVFRAVLENEINFSVARELNKCTDEAQRRTLLDQAIRSGTSARVVKSWVDQWRAFTNPQPANPAPIQEQAPAEPSPAYKYCCAACGGDRDPYNFVTVQVHKWEWDAMLKMWQEVGRQTA